MFRFQSACWESQEGKQSFSTQSADGFTIEWFLQSFISRYIGLLKEALCCLGRPLIPWYYMDRVCPHLLKESLCDFWGSIDPFGNSTELILITERLLKLQYQFDALVESDYL
jgi:hypothetical protein